VDATSKYIVEEDIDGDLIEGLTRQAANITSVYFTDHCRSKPYFHHTILFQAKAALKNGNGRFFWDADKESLNLLYNKAHL
jgi:hypothetical protein